MGLLMACLGDICVKMGLAADWTCCAWVCRAREGNNSWGRDIKPVGLAGTGQAVGPAQGWLLLGLLLAGSGQFWA